MGRWRCNHDSIPTSPLALTMVWRGRVFDVVVPQRTTSDEIDRLASLFLEATIRRDADKSH